MINLSQTIINLSQTIKGDNDATPSFLQKTLLALPIIFSGNLLTGCKTNLSDDYLPDDKITNNPNLLQNKLKRILPIWENKFNAKIGMTIIADNGELSSHRGNEYFPVNSTIKAFIASHILLLVDKEKLDLNEKIIIKESDLIEYSPVCKNTLMRINQFLLVNCAKLP